MRLRTLLVFLLLVVPSAWYTWRNQDVTEFYRRHDASIMFVCAKSLASGQGFRIASLPEQPVQTKYPVLYPLYLSAIWKLNPRFPENLRLATWLNWPILVTCLALAWAYYRKAGFLEKRTWLMAALLAVNPYMILCGCNVFSEVFFTCWLLAVFLLGRREGLAMSLLAGVAAGCAYLSRTAGIALLISMPAWYLWRREGRRAVVFAGGMLPFVVGWTVWTRANLYPATDAALIYYTDYVKFEFLNVGLDNLALVLWKNVDELLYALGALMVGKPVTTWPVKILTEVIAVALIAGVVRLVRRGIVVDYALFALLSAGILVAWHYPPNERFALPLYPLLAAGLFTEVEHIANMVKAALRHKGFRERVEAPAVAAGAAVVIGAVLMLQLYGSMVFLPKWAQAYRGTLLDLRAAYAWIEENTAPSATILSSDDAVLYLFTGRRGSRAVLLPRWWYTDDREGITARVLGCYRELASYCRRRGFEYVYSTTHDLDDWTGDDTQQVQRVLQQDAGLAPVFRTNSGTVYKVRTRDFPPGTL